MWHKHSKPIIVPNETFAPFCREVVYDEDPEYKLGTVAIFPEEGGLFSLMRKVSKSSDGGLKYYWSSVSNKLYKTTEEAEAEWNHLSTPVKVLMKGNE